MDGFQKTAALLKAGGHPARMKILEVLGRDGEACVCHLENRLGQRQATISQHLMRLRQAGLVSDRRDGLNIYYSLASPTVARLLDSAWRAAAELARGDGGEFTFRGRMTGPRPACPCPPCRARARRARVARGNRRSFLGKREDA